jgi:hypothetical protein
MKAMLWLLLLSTSATFSLSAQKVEVSENGKRVICIITAESTKEGLSNAVTELEKHGVKLEIQDSQFNKKGKLKSISLSAENSTGKVTVTTNSRAQLKNGIQVTSDLSPGAKASIGIGSAAGNEQ